MSTKPRLNTRLDSVSQDDARIDAFLSMRHALPPDPNMRFRYRWPLVARQNQTPPNGLWTAWILLAGRGFGKTRTGAEWVRSQVESGCAGRIALVARTPAEIRDTMIQGESGILSISPPWSMPEYESTKRKLTWPNGATAFLFSSYEPDQLRGPQFDAAWCDELASWKYPRDTWDNLAFALRLGSDPRCVVTTTPKPVALLRELVARPDVVVTRGTTYDNEDNLAPSFYSNIRAQYEGTRTGRQEIHADLLDQSEDALWERQWIDDARLKTAPESLAQVVVAIDPAVTSNVRSDETGIVVAGVDSDKHYYVIADGSGRMSPNSWAERAIALYDKHSADRIIGEVNNGGDLVKEVLRTASGGQSFRYVSVNASRGKYARAEPVAAFTNRARSTTSAPSPTSKTRCVPGLPRAQPTSPPTAWTPSSGPSPNSSTAESPRYGSNPSLGARASRPHTSQQTPSP